MQEWIRGSSSYSGDGILLRIAQRSAALPGVEAEVICQIIGKGRRTLNGSTTLATLASPTVLMASDGMRLKQELAAPLSVRLS